MSETDEYLQQYLHAFTHEGVDQRFMGYPESPFADNDRMNIARDFSKILLNNAGDPFDETGHWKTHTKKFEREVVNFFAKLFEFQDYWGYVTSGGTEGNLQGMLVGRNYLRLKYADELASIGKQLPVFVTSKASHYSLKKNADILFLDYLEVRVNDRDEIDLLHLEEVVSQLPKERPILMNVNIGTTMRGAIDNVNKVVSLLDNMGRDNVYYHADMALYGLIYRLFYPYDEVVFKERIGSFAISGHKLLTVQMPSGIFVGKNQYVDVALCGERISYIGCMDRTISGSRNGLLPLLIHAKISHGVDRIKKDIEFCLENCSYLFDELTRIGIDCKRSSNPGIIVYFPELADSINNKYQLACHDKMSHVVCMPHVNRGLIDQFIHDIVFVKAGKVPVITRSFFSRNVNSINSDEWVQEKKEM